MLILEVIRNQRLSKSTRETVCANTDSAPISVTVENRFPNASVAAINVNSDTSNSADRITTVVDSICAP